MELENTILSEVTQSQKINHGMHSLIREKIFTNPTSDRGLISNIYKELKKLDPRKPNNPIKKWGTELNKEFSPEELQMAEKYLKKCSTTLVIR